MLEVFLKLLVIGLLFFSLIIILHESGHWLYAYQYNKGVKFKIRRPINKYTEKKMFEVALSVYPGDIVNNNKDRFIKCSLMGLLFPMIPVPIFIMIFLLCNTHYIFIIAWIGICFGASSDDLLDVIGILNKTK